MSDKKGLCYELLDDVSSQQLSGESVYQYRQTVLLLLIGELYGLNTLGKLLFSVGISSRNCYKIWGKFTYRELYDWINKGFVNQFETKFRELCKLGDSSWSRAGVTIIMDETIFKTWLQCRMDDERYLDYFGKKFSGQTKKSEYGFRFSLTGVSINGEFHPLYINPIKVEEKCEDEAIRMIKKVSHLMLKIADIQDFTIPNVALSVDGSYNKSTLIEACKGRGLKLDFICVPRKNNIVKIGNFEGSLTQYVEQEFLPKEKEQSSKRPFYMRKKGFYNSKNEEVVFLFFRLNGSKKVSIIYSTNTKIKAKTMRRRWFNRTKIENFFRLIKHTLKVQQSTADSTEKFFKKVMLFSMKAVFIKSFEKYCQKNFKEFKGSTFWQLRQKIIYSHCDLSIIFDQLERCMFCKPNTVQQAKRQYFKNIGKSPN